MRISTGQKVERLLVLELAHTIGGNSHWRVRCDCGTEKIVSGTNLGRKTKSCGCLRRDLTSKKNTSHGMSKSPEYNAWNGMLSRCYNSKYKGYKDYGGRGILVCNRWRYGEDGKSEFECFFEDMGLRSSSQHSMDRWPDNDGNYEPSNYQWATQSEQILIAAQ